jgi:hypothetical protein
MNYFYYLLLFFFCLQNLPRAQSIKLVAELNINYDDISKKCKRYTIAFYTNDKKLLAKCSSFDISDIIDEYIKNFDFDSRKRLFLVAENDSTSSVYDYYGFTKEYSVMPAVLIYKPVRGLTGDTIRVYDKNNNPNDMDLSPFGKELERAPERKYYMPVSSLSKNQISEFFVRGTILFPQDANTKKWITNIRRIKIYFFEK